MASEWEETTELELTIKDNFQKLSNGFEQVEKVGDAQQAALLKDFTGIMQDCKRLIKDFEREARTDGMPPKILSDKKRQLVQELNTYIALKKTKASQLQARSNHAQQDLPPSSSGSRDDTGNGADNVRNDKLIEMGRREIKETDKALERARKVVEETIGIGAETAAALNDQTKQMEGILNDLDDITFNMQKAQKVIAQITKGLVTDKCILCLLFLVVLLAIGAIVLSVVDFGGNAAEETAEQEIDNALPDVPPARRLLRAAAAQHGPALGDAASPSWAMAW